MSEQLPSQETPVMESPTRRENLWFSSSMMAGITLGLLGGMGLSNPENLNMVMEATGDDFPLSAGFWIEQLKELGLSDQLISIVFLSSSGYFFLYRISRKAEIAAHWRQRFFSGVRDLFMGRQS